MQYFINLHKLLWRFVKLAFLLTPDLSDQLTAPAFCNCHHWWKSKVQTSPHPSLKDRSACPACWRNEHMKQNGTRLSVRRLTMSDMPVIFELLAHTLGLWLLAITMMLSYTVLNAMSFLNIELIDSEQQLQDNERIYRRIEWQFTSVHTLFGLWIFCQRFVMWPEAMAISRQHSVKVALPDLPAATGIVESAPFHNPSAALMQKSTEKIWKNQWRQCRKERDEKRWKMVCWLDSH